MPKHERPVILVNATAAIEGGALNILYQFILSAISHKELYDIYVFTSVDATEFKNRGINIITLKKGGAIGRIHWDHVGFKKWVLKKNIRPSLIVSFQNTGVNFDGSVPQLIYYHQPAPFSTASWNVFDKEERVFWFYKHIYPLFTKVLLTKKTYFVVQTSWIMEGVARKFHIDPRKILILRPEIHLPAHPKTHTPPETVTSGEFKIFYPAIPFINKNHIELVEALNYLVNIEKCVQPGQIKIICTCDFDLQRSFIRRLVQLGLQDYFVFTGKLKQEQMSGQYAAASLLVFPSVLETFGLPLIEAASFGLKILAADMNYAREVLADYDGVEYIKVHAPQQWAQAIMRCYNHPERFSAYQAKEETSWKDFFAFAATIIGENN